MSNATSKSANKIKKKKPEVDKVVNNLVADLAYRDAKMHLMNISIVSESKIKDVLSRNSTWDVSFRVDWSKFSVDQLNESFIGLILEALYFDLNNEKIQDDLFTSTELMDKVISKNEEVKNILANKSIEAIVDLYKGNTYSLSKIEYISFKFKYIDDLNVFVPTVDIRIQVFRERS
jgi:hypothetical protein